MRYAPPIPASFIAWISALMPSFETAPCIQYQNTQGLAEADGERNCFSKSNRLVIFSCANDGKMLKLRKQMIRRILHHFDKESNSNNLLFILMLINDFYILFLYKFLLLRMF